MSIDSGKDYSLTERLTKRVTILRQTDETDGYGARLEQWLPVATVWAGIEPLQGREFFAAEQIQSEVTTRIRIRYRTGIDRAMRVRHGDTEFEVLDVIHPQFGKWELQLMSRERQ